MKKIPLTEDLKLLREHIVSQMKQSINALEERVLPEHWISLAKNTLCRLILFNMRRQAEVKDLKVHDYISRPDWSQDQTGEFDMALSSADRILAKRMDMMIAAGKSRKNVDAFVLLPPEEAVEILIKHRSSVGVSETNPYIFARRNADSPFTGTEELRKITDMCPGLVHPERISSNALRKYIATVSKILDMTDKEVEMLAVHLGHDVKTHKENYRLAHSTRELTSVAQLLLTVEKGNVNHWRGKSLRDVNAQEAGIEDEDNSFEPERGDGDDDDDIDYVELNLDEVNENQVEDSCKEIISVHTMDVPLDISEKEPEAVPVEKRQKQSVQNKKKVKASARRIDSDSEEDFPVARHGE